LDKANSSGAYSGVSGSGVGAGGSMARFGIKDVETMFLTDKKMFLGTTTGMAVFDISNPTTPVSLTFFTHARSCDPVVV
jgi:hypothetical protein